MLFVLSRLLLPWQSPPLHSSSSSSSSSSQHARLVQRCTVILTTLDKRSRRTGIMQHRAYQPILPCGNKYLQLRWDKSHYDMHKEKVQSAKPTVSTAPPRTYDHLRLKMKKLKLEEERMSIIQRDNKLLLDKISAIMRTTGRIDNRNDYENRSLCAEKRQQEVLRVTRENRVLVERLSRCGSTYSARRWREDWRGTERLRDSIARYPRSGACLEKAQPKPSGQATTEVKGETSDKEEGRSGGEKTGYNAPSDASKTAERAKTDREEGSGREHGAEANGAEVEGNVKSEDEDVAQE